MGRFASHCLRVAPGSFASWANRRQESGDEAKLIMRLGGYRGRYLLHGHNLEHEDRGMMARFDVV
jgi:FtsP/CotA-like multicopper oxidase with cupredoxin domain